MTNTTETPISPVTATRPELILSAASVNQEPVELDGTPTSAEELKVKANASSRGSKSAALGDCKEILADMDGGRTMGAEERAKRDELMSMRKSDPAVLVDIPQTPGAEELRLAPKKRLWPY